MRVRGTRGDDVLNDSPERDLFSGGPGEDNFTFHYNSGQHDVILDFQPGVDNIDLSPLYETFIYQDDRPHGTMLYVDTIYSGGTIFLLGVHPADIHFADDFILY